MLRRSVLFLACFLVAVAWQAPATWADVFIQRLSMGSMALVGAEGSLWSGTGTLAVPEPSTGRFTPFMQVRWAWQPAWLLRGQFRWQFSSGGAAPAAIALTPRGAEIELLQITMPARYALERIPHAIGHAGWRGDLTLFVQRWQCNWRSVCTGDVNLQWFGVASDLFPMRQFGDYQLNIHAQDGNMDLQLATLRGAIQLQAQGKIQAGGHVDLAGNIQGEPAFVDRLPNIAGKLVTPDGQPGHLKFAIHQ